MQYDYWLRPDGQKKLFPELEWEKPERRDQRGKLAIIGGNVRGFAAVAEAYSEAVSASAGQVRVVVPDTLKPSIEGGIDDVVFTPSNQNGTFAKQAEKDMKAAAQWADAVLLIGDTGRNSETAMCFEQLLHSQDKLCIITRDALDLLKSSPQLLLEREHTALVTSFAQLQKLLRSVYFPRAIVFTMHLGQFVEVLHKISLSYPSLIVTCHSERLVFAHSGRVATLPLSNPMSLWRGEIAVRVAVRLMQHPGKVFEAAVSSIDK